MPTSAASRTIGQTRLACLSSELRSFLRSAPIRLRALDAHTGLREARRARTGTALRCRCARPFAATRVLTISPGRCDSVRFARSARRCGSARAAHVIRGNPNHESAARSWHQRPFDGACVVCAACRALQLSRRSLSGNCARVNWSAVRSGISMTSPLTIRVRESSANDS